MAGMRVVIQRVSSAGVDVVDAATGEPDASFEPQRIGPGLVLLVAVSDDDGPEQISWTARKIANLRIFDDDEGRMNRSVLDVGGEVLSISQFTLYGDVRRGNRPSFVAAGQPDHARDVWLRLDEALRGYGLTVREGRFAAHMRVSLTNDGPVTIPLDTAVMARPR